MTWWGPFGCGFVAGLFVGQVTLGSWLSSVRAGPLRLWSPATFKSEVPAQSWRKEDRSYSWADGRALGRMYAERGFNDKINHALLRPHY